MDTSVKVSSNWTLIGGSDIAKTVQSNISHEDVFIKPELDEILAEDRAVLLCQPSEKSPVPCNFQIRIFPRYKIESLTMVCSAAKAELFLGQQKEYAETLYGSPIHDSMAQSNDTDGDMISSFRYDIEINKSGINEVILKLLTNTNEICIFGVFLKIAPNPNGITTLLPNAINLENVQQMLNTSNSKLSPNAEKCKMFMQMYKTAQNPTMGLAAVSPSGSHDSLATMLQQIKQIMPKKTENEFVAISSATVDIQSTKSNPNEISIHLANDLKVYIDTRLAAFETKLWTKLIAYESRQSDKLDKILLLLETKNFDLT